MEGRDGGSGGSRTDSRAGKRSFGGGTRGMCFWVFFGYGLGGEYLISAGSGDRGAPAGGVGREENGGAERQGWVKAEGEATALFS